MGKSFIAGKIQAILKKLKFFYNKNKIYFTINLKFKLIKLNIFYFSFSIHN